MMKCREMMFRKALLPVLESPFDDECRSHSANMHCFKGGDSRTNEQPGNIFSDTVGLSIKLWLMLYIYIIHAVALLAGRF